MFKKLVTYFLFPGDAADPETAMKGKYFILSTIVFLIFTSVSFPYFIFVVPEEFIKHPEIVYSNFFFVFLIIGLLFVYRKAGGRVIMVNVITAMGYGSNYGTYESTGGIWSSDLVWGFIISSWVFLVANTLSGTIWMILSLAAVSVLYYAELTHMKDFIPDLLQTTSSYPFFNFFLGALFLLAILYLYETAKKQFVRELRDSKTALEHQKQTLETQKEEILSSIAYARKIQDAVLPHEEIITRSIPLSFILYKPRDIVSGDFYWFHEIDRDNYIFVCGDCTGHGVPGAFMTVIGTNILSQIVKENKILSPGKILNELDRRINETLKQDHSRYSEVQDGMDLALMSVNKARKEFTFTSAKRPAIFIRNGELHEFKGSKLSIGGMRSGEKLFEELVFTYKEDDMLYLFTDGYIDQFGGPENKKFMIKRFRELLKSIAHLPASDQKRKLDDVIVSWIGRNEQTDDILVTGIRF